MFRHFVLIVLVFGLTHAWDLEIQRLWDGSLLESKDFVQLCINQTVENDAVEIHIKAPFYNDPAPDAEPGKNLKLKISSKFLKTEKIHRRSILWIMGLRSGRSLFPSR